MKQNKFFVSFLFLFLFFFFMFCFDEFLMHFLVYFFYFVELKNVFDMAHQVTGAQPTALANAGFAYAANIDNRGMSLFFSFSPFTLFFPLTFSLLVFSWKNLDYLVCFCSNFFARCVGKSSVPHCSQALLSPDSP
jgi:hypothetical protein